MRVTKITDNNIKYFDPVIGDMYGCRTREDLFIGVLDNEDSAVGVSVFRDVGEALLLTFLYVDDNRWGEGFAKGMLNTVKNAMKDGFAHRIVAYLFLDDDEHEYFGIPEFLISQRFKLHPDECRRSLYDYGDIKSKISFTGSSMSDNVNVKRVSELSEEEINRVIDAFGESDVLSETNLYGGILFYGDDVKGAMTVEPFAEGIRLSALHSTGDAGSILPLLFENTLSIIEEEGLSPGILYVDSAGNKLQKFEDSFMAHMGIEAVKRMESCAFVWEVAYE